MPDTNACYWPIIYVRGYAMTRGEINETTADPFCGFNLGSTTMRARPDKSKPPQRFIFESPLVRLRSDFKYCDIYEDGVDIADPGWKGGIPLRSIIIHRYYDSASTLLGTGETPEIETFARELSNLILAVRARACENKRNHISKAEFRCYLVAHSMGGLVCRAFLQNPDHGSDEARRCVDKFFTYATPHNGIDMANVNVPEWLAVADINNFNRKRMAEYLALADLFDKTRRVDWIRDDEGTVLPSKRVFCMIGTNRSDYDAAAGVSRAFAGHGSDGLVRIANASVTGIQSNGERSAPAATAYAYRSHSGPFGIVNSEEAYQNLARFLFGDVRVDLWLDIDEVFVPEELEKVDRAGKVDALYKIEVLAAPRGKRWFLTRRVAEEDSAAARSHADLRNPDKPEARRVYLSTIFLANRYRVNPKRRSLAYGLQLGVLVPDYEVNKRFWPNRHYEGQYLFRDAVVLEMTPPAQPDEEWQVVYDWQSDNVGQASVPVRADELGKGRVEITIPFATSDTTPPRSPGIAGKLRFVVSRWNDWNEKPTS